MTKLIKETPILRGNDAKIFLKKIETTEKISKTEKERIKSNFEKIKSLFKKS
jgi:hypothetical protein